MWIGIAEFDFLLGDVHSLKQKRSVIRPVIGSPVGSTALVAYLAR